MNPLCYFRQTYTHLWALIERIKTLYLLGNLHFGKAFLYARLLLLSLLLLLNQFSPFVLRMTLLSPFSRQNGEYLLCSQASFSPFCFLSAFFSHLFLFSLHYFSSLVFSLFRFNLSKNTYCKAILARERRVLVAFLVCLFGKLCHLRNAYSLSCQALLLNMCSKAW